MISVAVSDRRTGRSPRAYPVGIPASARRELDAEASDSWARYDCCDTRRRAIKSHNLAAFLLSALLSARSCHHAESVPIKP
jgi:hypothetical protein